MKMRDRLVRMRHGHDAVLMLFDQVTALDWRPDEDEVVCLGRALLALDQKLHRIVTDSRRRHKGPPPKYGFRRGPRAGG